MPYQPAWFHRLDEILETLRGMESSHLDRLAVQKLFGVRELCARQIMAGLPGLRAGNASVVLRTALIARLEETASGGLFQWEVRRRARVVEELVVSIAFCSPFSTGLFLNCTFVMDQCFRLSRSVRIVIGTPAALSGQR